MVKQMNEITYASSTLPKPKTSLHGETEVQSSTLPKVSSKSARSNRNKVHVKFDDLPTIIDPFPEPSSPSPSRIKYDGINTSKNQNKLGEIEKVQYKYFTNNEDKIVETNQKNIPSPVDMATLPSRHSLSEGLPFDIRLSLPITQNDNLIRSENSINEYITSKREFPTLASGKLAGKKKKLQMIQF